VEFWQTVQAQAQGELGVEEKKKGRVHPLPAPTALRARRGRYRGRVDLRGWFRDSPHRGVMAQRPRVCVCSCTVPDALLRVALDFERVSLGGLARSLVFAR
jgi:hypothetical protein